MTETSAAVQKIVEQAFEAGKRWADDSRLRAVRRTLLCLACRTLYVWYDGRGLSAPRCPECGSIDYGTNDAPEAV